MGEKLQPSCVYILVKFKLISDWTRGFYCNGYC